MPPKGHRRRGSDLLPGRHPGHSIVYDTVLYGHMILYYYDILYYTILYSYTIKTYDCTTYSIMLCYIALLVCRRPGRVEADPPDALRRHRREPALHPDPDYGCSYMCTYIYIYIYMHTYMCIYVYIIISLLW